jgi:hypothetical protein
MDIATQFDSFGFVTRKDPLNRLILEMKIRLSAEDTELRKEDTNDSESQSHKRDQRPDR